MQLRVPEFDQGLKFYERIFGRKPDFVPHEGFAEWEVVPGAWLQIGEGEPTDNRPIRFGVQDLEQAKSDIMAKFPISDFEVFSREEVPVKWGTFEDPWGNKIGFFEYLDQEEEKSRIQEILSKH
ncbi:VOC family protein [Piscibacillus salipiscarius]|nr:ornithine monooxygenase [Piscibacillus salipiscarius]